jgi:hypothetical protein
VSTAVEVKIKLKSDLGIDISVESVRRIFRRNGLSSKTKRKKPILKKTHRKRRLAWAKKYRDFTVDDWRLVLWSDESKFQLFGSDGRKYCWVKANEQLNQRQIIPTMKFGGGAIMVWGCMNAEGVGQLKKIDVKMNADIYVDILNENLLGSLSAKGLSKEEIFYQQDNDPKHTSKKVRVWFLDNEIDLLDWPAQSPDLNPIENLWNEVDRWLRQLPGPLSSKDDLWTKLQIVWNGIEADFCERLVSSMPKRVNDVIKAKGGYTKW